MKRGVTFDKNRDDRCTYLNFDMMYKEMYTLMAETGITTMLNIIARWFNKSGKIVESKDEEYRKKSEYMLMHPE